MGFFVILFSVIFVAINHTYFFVLKYSFILKGGNPVFLFEQASFPGTGFCLPSALCYTRKEGFYIYLFGCPLFLRIIIKEQIALKTESLTFFFALIMNTGQAMAAFVAENHRYFVMVTALGGLDIAVLTVEVHSFTSLPQQG
jgi:hypothetical protein